MTLKKRGEVYHVWFSVRGRKTSRSTGKKNLRAAEARAREIIEAARDERFDVLSKIRGRRSAVSIDTILAIYQQVATCRRSTLMGNCLALRKLCILGAGLPPDQCALANIDRPAVLAFHRAIVARGKTPERGETTARTMLRQARSVFSPSLRHEYPDSISGDLAGFLDACRGVSANHRATTPGFKPIPPRTLRSIYRDAIRLRAQYPAAWRMFLLMVRCGLSNRECHHARGTWLRDSAIHIPASDGSFRPKSKNRVRSVSIRPDRYQRYFSSFEGAESKVCVNSLWLQRAVLSPMLRRHLPDRQKGLYELRKHAGSIIATRDGLYAAARFLGDRADTAERYYAAFLQPIKPI